MAESENVLCGFMLFVSEAETRQKLLRTVKKEVGVFINYRVGKANMLVVVSLYSSSEHTETSWVIPVHTSGSVLSFADGEVRMVIFNTSI